MCEFDQCAVRFSFSGLSGNKKIKRSEEIKGNFPERCRMCICYKYKPEQKACCGCLEYGCPCGSAPVEQLGGREQCKACNCRCGHYFDERSKLFECKPCFCQEKNLCECDTGCCGCPACFPSSARLTLENGEL